MFGYDLFDVGNPDSAVHDPLGIDEHRRSELAGTEAAGSGDLESNKEVSLFQLPTEFRNEILTAVRRTTTLRVAGWAGIDADENVQGRVFFPGFVQ